MVCVSEKAVCDTIDCTHAHMFTLKYMCEYEQTYHQIFFAI